MGSQNRNPLLGIRRPVQSDAEGWRFTEALINTLCEGLLILTPGLSVLTGYAQDEVVGHTAAELRMWASEEDRRKLAAQGDSFHDLELSLSTRAGEVRTVLLSCESIRLMKVALEVLTSLTYRVPEQNLHIISLTRVPAIPKSRFVMSHIRRGG